jgi:hypothetical protein
MTDAIKFTEEELKSIQEIQGIYNQITLTFGSISVQRINLNKQEEALITTLMETRTKESDLAKELTDKYGKGSLDINTGEFTPTLEETPKSPEETPQE